MAKESHTARLRLVAAALFAVLWTLTVWTVGHPPARATSSLRVPAAEMRGAGRGAANGSVSGAKGENRFAPKMGQGCERLRTRSCGRKVFLDMGGHDGSSITEFIDNIDEWVVWAWEPNPMHEAAWRALEAAHPHLCYIGRAVWVADEDLTLYIDTSKPEAKGTGIVKKEYGGKHSDAHRLTVRTEDIHVWLLQHTCPDDEIVVKMDIEGAEYPVLQRMLANGSACRIRTLYIEFHAKMDPLKDKVGAQHSNRKETVHQLVLKQMLHDACQPGVDVQIVE